MIKSVASALVALSSFAFLTPCVNAQSSASSAVSSTAPDNTKNNKLDRSSTSPTADTQSNTASDVDLTKRIRQSVMDDKSLSTYAHNVKIVTVDGDVTLKGVVRSHQERDSVEKKAVAVAGKDKVTNQLKIAPAK